MKIPAICVVFLVCGAVLAQKDESDEYSDFWASDYDDTYDYDYSKKMLERFGENSDETGLDVKTQDDTNNKSDEVKKKEIAVEDKERSQEKVEENNSFEDEIETLDQLRVDLKELSQEIETNENKNSEKTETENEWEDERVPPLVEDDKTIFDETKEILSDSDKDVDDFEEEKQEIDLLAEQQSDMVDIIDETKKLLADNDSFDNIHDSVEDDIAKAELLEESDEVFEDSDEDSIDQIKEDLDEDLRRLLDTLDQLDDDDSKNVDDGVLDYDEENNKPIEKSSILSQKDYNDYEEINDSNLSEIFAENAVKDDYVEADEDAREDEVPVEEPKIDADGNNSDDVISKAAIIYQNDALVDGEKADSDEVEEFDVKPNLESQDIELAKDTDQSTSTILPEDETKVISSTTPAGVERRTKMVDELSSSELDDLMTQFSILHKEDVDIHSETFNRNVEPIHIKLSLGEPVIITSPNYPVPYPTNNIVDWIIEGTDGTGIEFNVTDFAVNGALGDYVLVKPGGIDESGTDGLIFSYRLNSERRYRFSDVDKMFIRFEAKQGMMFMRGFQFSVRLMNPLPADELEEIETEEEEEIIPQDTIRVFLGGITPERFPEIKEEFRTFVATMASQYILDNEIDPGTNSTIDTVRITDDTVCNIQWPDFENCVAVSFGVPLVYHEDSDYRLNREDLETMWLQYTAKEKYVSLLENMGVHVFLVPNDDSILMVWLVIAAGVVISMAMLAFALWRFSCFEDYTRMKTFSDTDSLKSGKLDKDLYPTPHQILPPLYAENEYSWPEVKYGDSTSVDMGGVANKSYLQDDPYDFDSDEDVVNRSSVTPRDIYNQV